MWGARGSPREQGAGLGHTLCGPGAWSQWIPGTPPTGGGLGFPCLLTGHSGSICAPLRAPGAQWGQLQKSLAGHLSVNP